MNRWKRSKPIKLTDVARFPVVAKRDTRDVVRGLHGDGYDYFMTVPTKRGMVIWYGRTTRESPTRH